MTCPDDLKFEVVKRAQAWFRERYPIVDIDGVRVQFQEGGKNVGWGLIRASNTGPCWCCASRPTATIAARARSRRWSRIG